MSREVLFVAGMADEAQEIPVFRQLAGLVATTQSGITYIDGLKREDGQAVALGPEEQSATIAAKVDEIISRNPLSDFRLVAHGLGALPTVHFLTTEKRGLDAYAFLVSPWDVSAGTVDADMVNRNSTHDKASIIVPHLEEIGMFSREFATDLEELSDDNSVRIVCMASEWNDWKNSCDSIARSVTPENMMYVTGNPDVAGSLDRVDVKKLLQAVLF